MCAEVAVDFVSDQSVFDLLLEHRLIFPPSSSRSFVLILAQIDHCHLFKDLYGTAAVENCLCLAACGIELALRHLKQGYPQIDSELVLRREDGRFAIFLPGASPGAGFSLVAEIRKRLSGLTAPYPSGPIFSTVAVHFGIASCRSVPDGFSADRIIEKAEAALLKSQARNITAIEFL